MTKVNQNLPLASCDRQTKHKCNTRGNTKMVTKHATTAMCITVKKNDQKFMTSYFTLL